MIKALASSGPGSPLKAFEFDPGPLSPDCVEVQIEHCGLCHSDLSMKENHWQITQYPFVPGHEVVGIISRIGTQVSHLQVGTRVGVGWFAGSCLTCGQCMSGNQNLCPKAEQTIVGRFGGFASHVRCQAIWATPLPSEVAARTAGPLFCGGITVFNPLVQFDVSPMDKVGVIGIGGLGHLALQFLNA